MKFELEIEAMTLDVKLGVPEAERLVPQTVIVSIHITIDEPFSACYSDQIAETFCYATLLTQLEAFCAGKTFCLLETLGYQLHQQVTMNLRQRLDQKIQVRLRVTKDTHLKNIRWAHFTVREE